MEENYKVIKRGSKEYVIMQIKRIVEFCNTYHMWPNQREKYKDLSISDGTTSLQLYGWLNNSGYFTGYFRYSDIKDKTGRSVKDILDILHEKYLQEIRGSNEYVIKQVKRIVEFCNTYHIWPNTKHEYINKSISDGTTSLQLYGWLNNSGYFTGYFRYSDIKDKTGRSVKDILDELYEKYSQEIRGSNEYIIKQVKRIVEFCNTYHVWPNLKKEYSSKSINDGTTSAQLYAWLNATGYVSGDFKYSEVKDETGRLVKDILNELHTKYSIEKKGSNEVVIRQAKKIVEFCNTYHIWPNLKKEYISKCISDGTTSAQLYSWLNNNGYITGNFKYSDVKDETGRLVKDILDELYTKYKKAAKESYDNIKEEFDSESKFSNIKNSKEINNGRKIS